MDTKRKFSLTCTAVVIAVLLSPSKVLSAPIIIEPDDYAPGADLSMVSELVTIQSLGFGLDVHPVFAVPTRWPDFFDAPTGSLTFGMYGFGYTSSDKDVLAGYQGLLLQFTRPIHRVQILSQLAGWCVIDDDEFGPPFLHPDPLLPGNAWAAFDGHGALIQSGVLHTSGCGIVDLTTLSFSSVSYLVFGAGDASAVVEYDRLTFWIPEPSSIYLMICALGLFIMRGRHA